MLFTFCFLLSVFLFSIFFPHCENNCLFGGAYLVLVGNYLLLFIYAVYFLFTSFRFFVFYFFFLLREQTQRRLWTKVAILIEENSRQWNHELIDGIFTPLEAELIKAIPLSQCEAEDNLFWPFTSNGIYSSKSGYRFLKVEGHPVDDEQQRAHDSTLWRTIWSVPVPNKIKNLMWRACRNSLPTKENLVHRTVIECPTCDRCKHVLESALHAMWSCRKLDVVWENDAQWQCRRTQTFVDFKELLSWLIINQQDLKFFYTTAWLIWT